VQAGQIFIKHVIAQKCIQKIRKGAQESFPASYFPAETLKDPPEE
jgi:hypothetical protein